MGVIDKLVVLGDPGGGKTTLVHRHCLDLAESALDGRGQIPVLVKLREFDAHRARGGTDNLLDFMARDFGEASPDILDEELRTALHHLLVFGRCQVVLDGLDEVLSSPRRIQVRNIIQRFSSRYPCCPIIVTSRINGYEVAPLPGFASFQVAPLEDPQIERLHEALLLHALRKSPSEAAASYPAFIEEGRRAASEFIQNPLLLSLIIIIYHQYREIPDERARLYDACAQLLYD
jgi:predicted NACHT family NTPase